MLRTLAGPLDQEGGIDGQWVEEMEERCERGDAGALFTLGHYYMYLTTKNEYKKALDYLQRAEAKGSLQAKYQLGVMYYEGLGMPPDPSEGFAYMLEVAGAMNQRVDKHLLSSAQYNVGRAYYQGVGVSQSDERAAEWWARAGEGEGEGERKREGEGDGQESCVRAQHTLGLFYTRKDSLDLQKSFHWHSKAAENGNLDSMATIGLMYIDGQGCTKDEEAGIQWLRKSLEGGSVYGTGMLSYQYFTRKLFSKAAECAHKVSDIKPEDSSRLTLLERRGIAVGCFVLARCLQQGQVLTINEPMAHIYYQRAREFDKAIVAQLHNQLTHGLL